jgi:hypothetical protein
MFGDRFTRYCRLELGYREVCAKEGQGFYAQPFTDIGRTCCQEFFS